MPTSRKQRRLARFRARLSLQQALDRFDRPQPQRRPSTESEALAKRQRDGIMAIQTQIDKLDRGVFRLAVFGSVSRGKSALINALMGRELLQTGPTNGVTKWPQSLIWEDWESVIDDLAIADSQVEKVMLTAIYPETGEHSEPNASNASWDLADDLVPEEALRLELIDTPGIDEIAGEARAAMAIDVAQQVDAILFVVSGDVTQTEYDALCDLWQSGKPIVMVFNKIDLYPELDRQAIVDQLRALGDRQQLPLRADEIVLTAAQPAPILLDDPNPSFAPDPSHSTTTKSPIERWYTPPAQIDELKRTIARIIQRDGELLLAVNALIQAQRLETELAETAIALRDRDADDLIWNFVRTKAAVVACNPILAIDVLGGTIADLICIRQLAQLYGLPMTSHEAGRLFKTIIWSNGGLLLGEMLTGISLGAGKALGVPGFVGSAIAQAGIAGVGVYLVGQAAKEYLERGCTWGPLGADTVVREILAQVDRDSLCDRIRREFLGRSSEPATRSNRSR
jgi:GTPase SAR1 family protein